MYAVCSAPHSSCSVQSAVTLSRPCSASPICHPLTFSVNFFIDGQRLKLISKCVVPFGGGNVNGIRNIAGGLGLASFDNNASFVTELQVMF